MVKAGYKQTEVGVIPVDWDAPELGTILSSMQLGGNYKNSERETNWPLIKMGNLGRGNINLDKVEYIDQSQHPSRRDRLENDDVLFNTRNTLELVGKVAIWKRELPEAYFNSNILRMKFDERQVSSNRFMNFILNTPQSLKGLREIAIGTTSVAAIYSRDLVKLRLALPSKAEQEAIAGALSDADGLIEALEQLIAKKRAIKQGAMQKLLTPKADWLLKKLENIADVIDPHPSHRAPPETSNGIPFVGIGDLNEDGDIVGSKTRLVASSILDEHATRYDLNDGLIGLGRVASIGKVIKLDAQKRYAISPTLGVIRATKVDSEFLFYALMSRSITDQFARIMSGSTRSSVGMVVLRKLDICLPPTISEQTAIASVLSDMDAEIAALETKLSKARQIKQGMMQELLTGRIRLV